MSITKNSTLAYVRQESTPVLPSPVAFHGPLAWVRDHLFSTLPSSLLTFIFLAFIVWIAPGIWNYLFFHAVWQTDTGDICRNYLDGACWAYVAHKLDYFRYGSYPVESRWRVDLVVMMGAILITHLLWLTPKRNMRNAFFFIFVLPFLSIASFPGIPAFLATPALPGLILAGGVLFAGLLWGFHVRVLLPAILFFVIYPFVTLELLGGSYLLSLPLIPTNLWGGILVTLIVAVTGIVFSLPIGIVLALGRRSEMPIVRGCCVLFIEFVRGVPLITVLFMANTMLPLFVPEELTPDRLLRPLVGVSLFAAAYMAEVVRAGLQAMPKGQFEGAMALGLSYWRMMYLIILPQALVVVIPGIVNLFIALFKDTTLVAIVGISDFLRTVDTARLDPIWAGPTISTTGYVFAALFYWVFCFGMSRYSLAMERRLNKGRQH